MGRTERNGHGGPLRVGDRYRLVEKLGVGGMSVVWRGYDEVLGRQVAVKVLSPRLADDQSFRDRLRQEALAAARLVHPHITAIFDFGEYPLVGEVTVPYVVMELNDGESVAARIRREGALPWREAVTIAVEVASALATAHAQGLVHRDVTPANVMLTGAGAKVVDFGISAAVGQRDSAPDGSLLGTPAYLAPERLSGGQVCAATDVYALGLLLYRSLTGRLPWPAETTAEALRAHLYAEPAPVPAQPNLPTAVTELCLRCLSKNPNDRPAATEVAGVLAATVGLQPISAPRESSTPTPAPARPAFGRSGLGRAVFGRPVPGRRVPALVTVGRAALSYLGLPGGVPQVSMARSLGRQSRTSWRQGAPAAVVSMALLLVGGLIWSDGRDEPITEQAQAATAAPPEARVPRGTVCAVRYQLRWDSGADYEAQLTVATTDAVSGPWRVRFAYPGSQRLVDPVAAVTQNGAKVTVRGRGKLRMYTLRGDYRGINALPYSFVLDGHRCRAEVLASVPARRDDREVSEAAGPDLRRPNRSSGLTK